jgi:hypothetical protein
MNAVPVEVQLLWAWFTVRARAVRQENPDRGEMVNTAIVIGVLAVIAITIGVILMTKAKSAANNIQTQ